ncbi:uncharacterized protein LOC107768428 [Nicotiana tabacum]|uniref:Uncharacterized protein LOC107768428 n=1 Tax=Nicotiana tabacum TaxID=4097 RepID=A0A1S3XSX1_TOBAC|nr:PREDICTED: uncharacterized protein LOC107768428 [Nicotiana tabacum]
MVPRDKYAATVSEQRLHQNFESMNPQVNDYDGRVGYLNTSLRLKSRSMSSDSDEDGRPKRFRPSPESNSEDGEMNFVNEANLLGLALKKTPSFLNLIETQLSEGKKGSSSSSPPRQLGRPADSSRKGNQMNSSKNANRNRSKMEDFAAVSEKLKASNFPAIKLKIGDWERVSRYEGDLIAKCYYAKRKLVWEILDGPLKSKIEMQWSDIIAIRAIILQNDQSGVLEIELNQPPYFYRETNPQPRKHTLWQQTSDFTGGQAPTYRRHWIRFPPGVLDKHYEKLLHYDARLNELSKQPFPSQLSPYFESDVPEFSDFFDNRYGSQFFPKMHHPIRFSSSVLIPNHPMHNKRTTMAPVRHFNSSFSVSGERRSNYANTNQRRVLLRQGPNNLVNVAMGNQTIGMLPVSTTPQANLGIPTQNYQAMYQQNELTGHNQDNVVLNYIENHLLNDNPMASSNELKLVGNADSMYSSFEHHQNGSVDATNDEHGLNFGYHMIDNYAQDAVPNNGLAYAEPINWMVPQETHQNLKLEQFMEHSTSLSTYSDTVHGCYPTPDVYGEQKSRVQGE